MVDKKINEKEAVEFKKKIYNHYSDERKEIMNNTEFKVDVFGNIIGQENISHEQILELHKFFSQNDVNINLSIKIYLLKPRKEV